MRTFIFSNCKKSSDRDFELHMDKLQLTPGDKLVFLNHCVNLYNRSYFNNRSKTVYGILRAFKTWNATGFFGQEALIGRIHKFNSVFLFDHYKENITVQQLQRDKEVVLPKVNNEWLVKYIADTKKIPTTGFAAYYLVQSLLDVKPEDIIMVNFYGSKDNSTGKCEEHAWDYEEKFIEKNMHKIFV